jgi:hypothetical protein
MELAIWGAEVAAVQRPDLFGPAPRSTAAGAAPGAQQGRARTGKACRSASGATAPGWPDQRRGDHHGRCPRRGSDRAIGGAGQPPLRVRPGGDEDSELGGRSLCLSGRGGPRPSSARCPSRSSHLAIFAIWPGKRTGSRCGTGSGSVHAELVALGIAHDISERPAVVVSRNEPGSKRREPGDRISLAVRLSMNIDVNSVLRDLAFQELQQMNS